MPARAHRPGVGGTVVLMLLAGALALAPVASAQSPPLAGETFTAEDPSFGDLVCDRESGEVTYDLGGVAAGPYPGRWGESGTVEFDASGAVTGFAATFRIRDDTNDRNVVVTGTRSFTPGTSSGVVSCEDNGASAAELTNIAYSATLPDGSTDTGATTTGWTWTSTWRPFVTEFGESATPPPPPPPGDEPTSKADCMNGGHAQYGYKNQGRCVSSVMGAFKGPGKKR